MSQGGIIAVITLLVTNLGTLAAAVLTVVTTRRGVAKENANRRLALENYADDIFRYHRDLRTYLVELANAGVIDVSKVDLTRFPPPPAPPLNGNK